MKFTVNYLGKSATFEKKVSLEDLIPENDPNKKEYICAKVNHRLRELTYEIYYDCDVEFLTVADHEGMKIYEASLRYVVAMAFHECYPTLKIRFAYNVSRCVSIHLLDPHTVSTTAMLIKINHEIEKIVKADYKLKRMVVSNEEAADIYKKKGYQDKLDILSYRPEKTVHLYECNGFLDYMYSHLVPSTGYVKQYKLRLYTPGFLIQYPRSECGGKIPEFEDAPTFGRTLKESHDWAKVVGVDTVARINEEIKTAGPVEFINVCEDRHNRMLAELGQLIEDDISNVKLICVAGPSSSGKTTFANRLRIELLSRGIRPIRISIDDYYKTKEEIPLGEDGKQDYETIDALDIEYFNQNMLDLINGEETELPKFDFTVGHRVPGRKLKLGPEEPIIIEGIHALNDKLTTSIPKNQKFKIFISPQAQINLDDHNPLSLTDLRLLRRLVRDSKFRSSPAEETLEMWPKVRAGEFKWIYSTQEGCDYVFNSFLPYELPVMKKYAMPLLSA
ncbi:MAG: nucleoside kinase, partial [Bacilli bacterium]|nr:nucleoside kinase [Bacilli bacterium]